MKYLYKQFKQAATVAFIAIGFTAMAQDSSMQYFRYYDKRGLNVYETTKDDTSQFKKLKVRIGGNFTQDFQSLTSQNNATPVMLAGVNTNQLMKLIPGFNLAMANLNVDVQLADGIRLNLSAYLSSRHHGDAWVKGGYIQFDKMLFLKSHFVDKIMERITVKVGDYEMDYGDQHYRRTDGGNSMYNPFVENYIMDEFTTEVGGEVYYHGKKGLLVMAGITNGELNPTVIRPTAIDSATKKTNYYSPAFHGKIGYDKQVSTDFRFRLTASVYANKSAAADPLFFGDRTGSHYFMVMENSTANSTDNAWSGRYNPNYGEQIQTLMINPFIKFKGLEFFGTYEVAQGRTITEKSLRQTTQYAADLIYRFPAKQNFWVAVRYNAVVGTMKGATNDVTINRMVGSVGWFITKNIMLKAEYVNQQYKNFAKTDIRSGGQFDGIVVQASVGF